jgi:purine nucleosidase
MPTVAPSVDVVVDDTAGPGRGQTIVDLRGQRRGPRDQPGTHVRVVLETDIPLGPQLIERVLTL